MKAGQATEPSFAHSCLVCLERHAVGHLRGIKPMKQVSSSVRFVAPSSSLLSGSESGATQGHSCHSSAAVQGVVSSMRPMAGAGHQSQEHCLGWGKPPKPRKFDEGAGETHTSLSFKKAAAHNDKCFDSFVARTSKIINNLNESLISLSILKTDPSSLSAKPFF